MSFNELVDKIVTDLSNGSFAIWCGAGISIPSGLPKADDLVKELLLNTRLKPNEQERISEIVPSKLPFAYSGENFHPFRFNSSTHSGV